MPGIASVTAPDATRSGCPSTSSTACSTPCAPMVGRSSARSSGTRPSSSTRSQSAADLPSGRGVETAPGRYRLRVAPTRSGSTTPSGRCRRSASRSRRVYRSGSAAGPRRASGSRTPIRIPRRSPSSASVPATSRRSPSRTACCSADRPSIPTTRPRAATFVVAVECAIATSTCFCTSMGTGPEVTSGVDVVLAELDDGFVVADRVGRPARRSSARSTSRSPTRPPSMRPPRSSPAPARDGRRPDMSTPRRALAAAPDHPALGRGRRAVPRLRQLHARLPDVLLHERHVGSDLDGTTSTASGPGTAASPTGSPRSPAASFRPHGEDRYRQWLTHKFATWWDQFGSSGCVGCGRCIAWCPVGIDVREELAVIAGAGACADRRSDLPAAPRAPAAGRDRRARCASAAARPRSVGFVTVRVAGTTRGDRRHRHAPPDGRRPPPPRRRGRASS